MIPVQGSKPGLPHGRRILYHLSHQGSPNDSDVFNNHIFLGPSVSAKMEDSINIGLLNRDQRFFWGEISFSYF